VLAVPDLVERAQEKTSEGIRVSLHPSINKGGSNPFQRMSLILVSDTPRQAGNIRIRVTDIQDKETLVESIAGPQIRKSPTSRGLAHRSWRTIEFGPQFVDRMPDNLVRINSLIGL